MNDKFDVYMKLLLKWNGKINLTAITEPSEIVTKHFLDSLACADGIKNGASVVDVGTGAGFPGIPLKIARPDIDLTLIESTGKKVNFLKAVCSELGLDAACINLRAEEAGRDGKYRESFDTAVSRAVARLSVLAEFCLPLVRTGGTMLAMKGTDIEDELKNAEDIIGKLGGKIRDIRPYTIKGTDITHCIITIDKTAPTPALYPRSCSKILKMA